MTGAPAVSVVIATYNWSGVLRSALRSVLEQTFADFEVLVIGDGCTDDSAAIVASFGDTRLRWHNLPANTGNQSMPNNKGIELARGTYVAYLGHDDLWHRTHLQHLVAGIEAQAADAAHSLLIMIEPPPSPRRHLYGLAPHGFVSRLGIMPSQFMHRRDIVVSSGLWRDYRTILMPPDLDFIGRIWDAGARMVPVEELTAFKFPSAWRPNSYVDKPIDEQAAYLARLQSEPDLQYRELLAAVLELMRSGASPLRLGGLNADVEPGSITEGYRRARGLAPLPVLADPGTHSAHNQRDLLKYLNDECDIVPDVDTADLLQRRRTPTDGLFVGLRWYPVEREAADDRWRWATNDAEIVITNASGRLRRLLLELMPGPGTGYAPVPVDVIDSRGRTVAQFRVDKREVYWIDMSSVAGVDETLRLHTDAGGQKIDTDPRIMNFGARSIRWE